jgi:DNA-binding protein HU-beta
LQYAKRYRYFVSLAAYSKSKGVVCWHALLATQLMTQSTNPCKPAQYPQQSAAALQPQQQELIHMNRKELIDALADKTGSSKADADRSIAALMEIITTTLKKGDNVALVGFGTFEVRKRAARIGRNPATGAELKIKASKAPAFKAGATLKAAVNGGK